MIINVILDSALDILSSGRGGKCEERRRHEREVKRVNRTVSPWWSDGEPFVFPALNTGCGLSNKQ